MEGWPKTGYIPAMVICQWNRHVIRDPGGSLEQYRCSQCGSPLLRVEGNRSGATGARVLGGGVGGAIGAAFGGPLGAAVGAVIGTVLAGSIEEP